MRKWTMIEEFRVLIFVPVADPIADRAVRRALAGDKFLARLRPAVRRIVTATPGLQRVRVRVSR